MLFPADSLEFPLGGLNNPSARILGRSGQGYAALGVAAGRTEAVIGHTIAGKAISSPNACVDRNLGVHEYTVQTHLGLLAAQDVFPLWELPRSDTPR